jgi:hypothetical protein
MLQRERGEGTPVVASPRLQSRMIEREQCLEALPAAVSRCLVSGATLITRVPRHLSLTGRLTQSWERDGNGQALSTQPEGQLAGEWNGDPSLGLDARTNDGAHTGADAGAESAGQESAVLLGVIGWICDRGEEDAQDEAHARPDGGTFGDRRLVYRRLTGGHLEAFDLSDGERPETSPQSILNEHEGIPALFQEIRNERRDQVWRLDPNAGPGRDGNCGRPCLCRGVLRETANEE